MDPSNSDRGGSTPVGRRRARALGIVLAGGLVLAACGGDDDDAASKDAGAGADIDISVGADGEVEVDGVDDDSEVCGLLTVDDFAAVGVELNEDPTFSTSEDSCSYASGSDTVSLRVYRDHGEGASAYDAVYDEALDSQKEDLEIGERAFLNVAQNQIWVDTGDAVVVVEQVAGGPRLETEQHAELAAAAIARL